MTLYRDETIYYRSLIKAPRGPFRRLHALMSRRESVWHPSNNTDKKYQEDTRPEETCTWSYGTVRTPTAKCVTVEERRDHSVRSANILRVLQSLGVQPRAAWPCHSAQQPRVFPYSCFFRWVHCSSSWLEKYIR